MRYLGSIALVLIALAEQAMAQPVGPRRTIEVTRPARAPVIDGDLSDWTDARWVSDMRQLQPVENAPPSQPTEVAFAYDSEALYVAARMHMAGPDDVEALMTRRDDTGGAERIIISLDTFNDRRTAYSFAVTAAGVRADWLHVDDTSGDRDASFNPVWEARVMRGPRAWTAEMRIPFSQLRFRRAGEYRWGVNINRFMPHRNEDVFWIVVPKGETGWSSYFGELRGIRGIAPSRRIEILPYVAGDSTLVSASLVDPDDPFNDQLELGARAGLDAKMGLGPSLTLDATINPDFGQVEADPAVVNLTAFETQFSERRPFFVEGAQHLRARGNSFYYSRRIGGPPGGATGADYDDAPTSTRILGAAKVTGRLPSRLSVGVLSALTQRITANTYDAATDTRGRVPIEPLASYNLVRLEQEFGASSSRVGATLSGVYRHIDDDPALASQFHRYATTGGVDGGLRLANARYEILGSLGWSAIGGDAAAITALQERSQRYYQRPDAGHVELDPGRTSLVGWTAAAGAAKRSGAWRWSGAVGGESPGFDLNDMGILSGADDISANAGVSYEHTAPSRWLHQWSASLNLYEEWNFDGDRMPAYVAAGASLTLPNYWNISLINEVMTSGVDDRLTRGGPLTGVGWGNFVIASLSNSFAARTRWNARVEWSESQNGWRGTTTSADLTVRPVDRLQIVIAPRYRHEENQRQYIDTIDGGELFGNRYLFANVARRELALQTRVQVAFTPDLAVEAYAEPFASSGAFTGFGELPAAASRELRRYQDIQRAGGVYTVNDGGDSFGFDDPDFTFLSLRSTVVVRWEFLPGSTLFAVWQQGREDILADPDALGHATGSLRAPGRNTLALKVSYWWPVD